MLPLAPCLCPGRLSLAPPRDLKPENFLLESKDEHSALKCTDFGLSVFFKPGEKFRDVVGSAYYVAPEVLRRSYGLEADIWSCGVILYILLSGVPPFWGETEDEVFKAILKVGGGRGGGSCETGGRGFGC